MQSIYVRAQNPATASSPDGSRDGAAPPLRPPPTPSPAATAGGSPSGSRLGLLDAVDDGRTGAGRSWRRSRGLPYHSFLPSTSPRPSARRGRRPAAPPPRRPPPRALLALRLLLLVLLLLLLRGSSSTASARTLVIHVFGRFCTTPAGSFCPWSSAPPAGGATAPPSSGGIPILCHSFATCPPPPPARTPRRAPVGPRPALFGRRRRRHATCARSRSIASAEPARRTENGARPAALYASTLAAVLAGGLRSAPGGGEGAVGSGRRRGLGLDVGADQRRLRRRVGRTSEVELLGVVGGRADGGGVRDLLRRRRRRRPRAASAAASRAARRAPTARAAWRRCGDQPRAHRRSSAGRRRRAG